MFQEHHLLPQCTVLENVLVPFLADGSASEEDQRRATDLLKRVGLAERLTHRPAELSGGERQRVAIARALVREPLLLLADEPTGNLDRTTAHSIANLLLELQAERNAILVVVTHSEAMAAALQRRMEIDSGRLVACAIEFAVQGADNEDGRPVREESAERRESCVPIADACGRLLYENQLDPQRLSQRQSLA